MATKDIHGERLAHCHFCTGINRTYRYGVLYMADAEGGGEFSCHDCQVILPLNRTVPGWSHLRRHDVLPLQFGALGYSMVGLVNLANREADPLNTQPCVSIWDVEPEHLKVTFYENDIRKIGTTQSWKYANVDTQIQTMISKHAYEYDKVLESPTGQYFSIVEGVLKGKAMVFVVHLGVWASVED